MPATQPPVTAPALTWRAGADKIAHAHEPRATRTLCGERIVDIRLAHDVHRNCRGCESLAADRERTPSLGLR